MTICILRYYNKFFNMMAQANRPKSLKLIFYWVRKRAHWANGPAVTIVKTFLALMIDKAANL